MRKNLLFSLFSLFILILAGCNYPGTSPTPTLQVEDEGFVHTEIARAVDATNTAAAAINTRTAPTEAPTEDSLLPSDTPSVELSHTAEPTLTPEPSLTPTITPTEAPCNKAKFILDVSIPDGTEFSPGESFTKTWRLQNIGSCTWDSSYKIIFASGDQMGGSAQKALTAGTVEPGHTVDVSINMIAPASPGEYQGFWKLKAADGSQFGIESPYDQSFWLKINVQNLYDFSMAVEKVNICGYGPGVVFQVVNTGTQFFESAEWDLRDLDTVNQQGNASDNPFGTTSNACGSGESDMDPGLTYYITAKFIGVIEGNNTRFTLTLCSADGHSGTCVTKTMDFIMPTVPTP